MGSNDHYPVDDPMTAKLITVDDVMSYGPCKPWTRELVAAFGDGLTPLEVSQLDVPTDDLLWLLLREEYIDQRTRQLLACRWAEDVLPIWDAQYPDDGRPRETIAVGRRFANGEATAKELSVACAAATAAWNAAWNAARNAACNAACNAAAAAWNAARKAAKAGLAAHAALAACFACDAFDAACFANAAYAGAHQQQLRDVQAVLRGEPVRDHDVDLTDGGVNYG